MTQAKHTEFAMKALDMADMFKMIVGTQSLEGTPPYSVELGTPDGPSTGGGKQAMQPIKLLPKGDGTTLVAGHANQVDRTAELRSYDFLAQSHSQRFPGAEFPIQRKAYDDLLARLEKFFKDQSLEVTTVQPEAETVETRSPVLRKAPAAPGMGMGMWIAVAVAVVVIGALAAVFAR